MKKIVSVLLILTMLLGTIGVFANETTSETTTGTTKDVTVSSTVYEDDVLTEEDEEILEEIEEENEDVSDEEVDEIIEEDVLDEIIEEEEATVEEEVYDDEISKDKVVKILTTTYKYMTQRDKYYKQVLLVLNKIEKIDNKALKKKAIVAFEKRYEKDKEKDQKVHHRIEMVLKYIKKNINEFTPLEKMALRKVYLPVVEKYNKHRTILIHINKKIKDIKKNGLDKEISALLKMADKYKKAGKLKTSAELYQKAIAFGVDKKSDAYKKAGSVLNQLEGKGPKVFVNGKRPDFDVKPFIKDGRTLVPLRKIAESLNAKVKWDQETNTVIFTKGGKKVEVPIGSRKIRVNGQEKEIDVPAEVTDGRTVVPARVISETLDSTVTYDEETEVITIEDSFGTEDNAAIDTNVPELGDESAETQQSEEEVINEIISNVE